MDKSNRATVWVVNHAGHNIEDAEQYGKIKMLTVDRVNIFATDRIKTEFKEKLLEFNPAIDFVLLSGSTILNVIATTTLKELNPGSPVSVLIFNFNSGKYVLRSI
jgi:hypothetical protein